MTPHHGNKEIRTVSLLGGLCFFLSAIEYMIPKPLPFIRIGLANLPLLLALDIMPFPSFMLLGALKVSGQALISGTLFSYVFLFSLGGTGVSILLMYALRRICGKEKLGLIGVSTAGALASNGAQLVLAYCFVFGNGARYIAAPVLALGTVTGAILGICAEFFIRRSRWYEDQRIGKTGTDESRPALRASVPLRGEKRDNDREVFFRKIFGSGDLAAAGLCMMPALLLNQDTKTQVLQFLFFWALAWLPGKKNNPLITIFVMTGIILFNLLVPYGELLFSMGPLAITRGALLGGIRRAVTLEGLFMLSRFCIRKDLALPGFFGEMIGNSFRVFSFLSEENGVRERNRQEHKNGPSSLRTWIIRLDELLMSLDAGTAAKREAEDTPGNYSHGGKTPLWITGRIVLAALTILAWLPIILRALSRL